MRQSVIGGHIGTVDLSRRTHVHVGGLAAVILAALILLIAAGGTMTFALGDGGRLAGDPAPPQSDGARYAAIFEQAAGPPWLAFIGLTAEQYQQKFDEVAGQGFRLTQIYGYSLAGEERFAPIFVQQSGPPLRAVYSLTAEQYQQKFDELTGQGFRVVQLSGYSLAGEERFAGIFEQTTGPAWMAFHGLTAEQFQQTFDEAEGQGFRLTQIGGYSVEGEERFAPIFVQQSGPPLRAVYSLTAEQYQQKFDELTGQGFRLVQFSGYSVGTAERFNATFVQRSGPSVRAVYGLTGQQYQQKFDELTGQGFRLVQFSGYTVD